MTEKEKKLTKLGTELNPMDSVDFDKQEQALFKRAAAFRAKHSQPGNPLGVVNDVVNIYSDGVRLSATIWRPSSSSSTSSKLPAILLCHGWGGKRAHLDFSYAPKFAAAGFIVLTFDYRTWGDSDPVLLPKGADLKDIVKVRKVIDPEWQLRDAESALWYLCGIPEVDLDRIGIWGSSFGGGHVIALAALHNSKSRVKVRACVCQIGSIDTYTNWVNRHPAYKGEDQIHNLAIQQSQGKIFPWTISNPVGLDGSPELPKIVFEHTQRDTIGNLDKIDNCNVLLLAAEEEELFPNEKNSLLVFNKLKESKNKNVKCELKYLPGGHYDAYNNPAYKTGLQEATKWFSTHLMNVSQKL